MAASTRVKNSRASSNGWKKRNDRGPHKATLPSGQTVEFVVPDSGMLLRSGRLPDRLRRLAKLSAAHSGRAEGYLDDLVASAMRQDRLDETVEQLVDDGLELRAWLVAEMVVVPSITAEEVLAGELPELDVNMLMEFAERKRNTDRDGKQLPIIVLDEWATFRVGAQGASGAADGGTGGPDGPGDVPDPDGGAV